MIVWFAASPVCVADGIPPLEIKPGFWEVMLTVQTSGPLPLPSEVLAKLTSAERARIEAEAQERAPEGPRSTFKRCCLKEKELQQQLLRTLDGEVQGCQQTVVSASRTRREIRVDCLEGVPHGGGVFRIEAMDPEKVEVSSDWYATDGLRTTKKSSTATLWWLGAACVLDSAEPGAMVPPAAALKATPLPAAPGIPPAAHAAYYYKVGREQAGRNDLSEALQSLNLAVKLDPQRATSYNARGYVYLRLRSYANAAVDFSAAIRLRPDYTNAYQNRAVARRHLGDKKGAAADSRRAAELEKSALHR